MKRLMLNVALLLICASTYAQPSKVQNAYIYMNDNDLEKAVAEIDQAVVHEKTIADAKAWYYRGRIYQSLYVNSFLEKPGGGLLYPNYSKYREDAVDKAIESFGKALALGGNKVNPNEIKQYDSDMSRLAYQEGVLNYTNKDWQAAGDYFVKSFNIREKYKNEDGSGRDFESAYNAGLSYRQAKLDEESEKYLRICIDNNFKPEDCYSELASIFEQKDKERFKSILSEARAKFPNNQDILKAEINIYIENGEFDKALANLNDAINLDAANPVLLFVRGTIYDQEQRELFSAKNTAEGQKAFDAAAADYMKTTELDPTHFEANYSLGAMHYNRGAEMINDANSIADDKQYKIAKEKAEGEMKKALPYLEKAHELHPEDISTMTSLKELYARTNEMDKYNAMIEKLKN